MFANPQRLIWLLLICFKSLKKENSQRILQTSNKAIESHKRDRPPLYRRVEYGKATRMSVLEYNKNNIHACQAANK